MKKLKIISKFMLSVFAITLMICLPNVQAFAHGTGGNGKQPTAYFTLDSADYG